MRRRLLAPPAAASAAWLLMVLLLALPALALAPGGEAAGGAPQSPLHVALHAALRWQADRVWTEPWRLVTAAWVHGSCLHLAANLLGAGLVAALGAAAGVGRREALAWLAAWPLTHTALAVDGQLQWYLGASGVLHAGVAIVGLHLVGVDAAGNGRRRRLIGGLLLAGLAGKCLSEQPWLGPARPVDWLDLPTVPLAHAAGALAGLLTGGWAALRAPPAPGLRARLPEH